MTNKTALRFLYKNYRDEVAERTVLPEQVRFMPFGTQPYHPGPGWFLDAWCLDRKERRSFKLTDILSPMTEVPYEQPTA